MEIVNKKISALKPAEYNPRRIKEADFEQLKTSIQSFEMVEPIVVNMHPDRKNIVVGGHQRLRAMKALGMKEAPCVEVNLTIEREKELNVRLNRNTGDFDFDMLANHFDQNDLLTWGFEEKELDFFKDAEEGMPDLLTGDKGELEQITFTLHAEQALIVREAMDKAKAAGEFDQALNQNNNGNALARICEAYVD